MKVCMRVDGEMSKAVAHETLHPKSSKVQSEEPNIENSIGPLGVTDGSQIRRLLCRIQEF